MSIEAKPGFVPSGVWRVQGIRNVLYLAGTSHLVTSEQIPFPSAFYAAYNDSEEIYLEVNNEASFFAQVRLMRKMFKWMRGHQAELICPKGRTLEDYLEPCTVEELKRIHGKNYSRLRKHTPLFVAFMGEMTSVADQYTMDGGVEDLFSALARKHRKPIRTLDDNSVDELALVVMDDILTGLKEEIQKSGADAVVQEKSLSKPEKINEIAWRTGDLEAIEEEIAEMKRETPNLYEKIGPERNRKWLPKLRVALEREHNVMVLVGCAHLGGESGLLQLLKEEGFKVDRLYGVDHMQK